MDKKNQNMIIDEQDLFTFIFFPEKIPSEKKDVIESDKSFEAILDFYRHLKANSMISTDDKLKKMIAGKIPAYSLENVICLYALTEPVTKQKGNRLAAESTELKPKMTTKTFVDNEKEYLIKVLNYGNNTKIFVFSTKDEIVRNFDIIVEPHNLKFHFKDNTEPLKIDKSIQAEKIEIRFT